MAPLSISQAWSETAEFVKREGRLLFPLSFMLIALPAALLRVAMPIPPGPGQAPAAGPWLWLVPLVLIATMIGNLAISDLALRPGTSVGEAIGRGAKRFLPLLGAMLVLVLAAMLVLFLISMVMVAVVPGALAGAQSGGPTPAMAKATMLTMALVAPLIVYFGARMLPLTPAAAVERGGPFALIVRSWRLTAGQTGRIVLFLILVLLAVAVLSLAVEAVAGILFIAVAGPIGHGTTSSFLIALALAALNTVIGACLASLIARIYAQLAASASGT
jgi:hypothetical protein